MYDNKDITNEKVSKSSSAKRMKKMRKLDKELGPERKQRKLDTMYMFGCVDVSVIIDINGDIWFKGVDLARALEMDNPRQAIYDSIDKKYTQTYEKLVYENALLRHIPGLQSQTTFVNETGMEYVYTSVPYAQGRKICRVGMWCGFAIYKENKQI